MRLTALAITTTVVVFVHPVHAPAPVPLDTVRALVEAGRQAQVIGARHGEAIWPGFRPDTVPMSFVIPSRGDVLIGWRGALPAEYRAIPGMDAAWRDKQALGAASTASSLQGRSVAQIVAGTLDQPMLAATAIHEAFHAFEGASRRQGRKFGQGENSILISTYPVFDVANEAAFALEGMLLADALAASSSGRKRELAGEFVAVRRNRHGRLSPEFAEFEQASELNEGLAEYALVRALQLIASEGPAAWRSSASRALSSRLPLLAKLTESENLSLRFRFYQTGPAQALLLDAIGGAGWKRRLMDSNATLQDMLALASGLDDPINAARARAERKAAAAKLSSRATAQVERLKLSRRAQADSILSRPGIKLVLVADSLPGNTFNSCGYDPQNLLQVSSSVRLHTRGWRPCAGGPTYAEFNVPSVQDTQRGEISAVIGEEAEIKLTSSGQPVTIRDGETVRDLKAFKLDAPRASVEAVRADVSRRGNVIEIHPKRP